MVFVREMKEEKEGILTTKDLFEKVWMYVSNLEQLKTVIPKLDYAIHSSYNISIIPPDAIFKAVVNTGGSEGTYIDLKLLSNGNSYYCGTIKTLEDDMDAYIYMGMIVGALTLTADSYLCINNERF
ncbi:MAG: hypothetical protein IKB01_01345 [Lachnospiraceae bacterium]|nr:hypothetical protein [Lachnospiraceae bacterium]